jgi:hypothetical protein
MESVVAERKSPHFENPSDAQVVAPEPGSVDRDREFNFFKHSDDRMKIPQGGGILAMAPIETPSGEDRPRTYQLWLSETGLWQIRTKGDKAQSEKLTRPENANSGYLDKLMRENVGSMARKSMMTVSDFDLQHMRKTGETSRDDSLNGKLSITVEGVVFIIPNQY